MTSLAARLTLLYAATFLIATAGILGIGYWQIDNRLVAGVDRLLTTENQRIDTHLDLLGKADDPAVLARGLRRTTDNAAALFRVEIKDAAGRSLFRSTNLAQPIVSAGGAPAFHSITMPDGERVRVGRFAHANVFALIATPLTNVTAGMWAYVEMSAVLLVAMIGVGVGLGYVLSQVALRPLRDIAATASRVGSDNLAERIPVGRRDDEVGALARLLNAMLDRIESSFRQIRQFTADASHELKTPLSLVRLHAEALLTGPPLSEPQENHVVAQVAQIDQLSAMIEDLLVLARADSSSMALAIAPHDPSAFLDLLAPDARVLAEASQCRLEIAHRGTGTAAFDAVWLRRIVFNLLSNAFRASPAGGTVTVTSIRDARGWRLAVRDEGPGVSADVRERLFDRFFTNADGGTGLGLAICRSIVELHDGTITAAPAPDGGLEVAFAIPHPPIT
ncbi:MAG: HAMP domain-containing protein [Sphingomonas sp.]|uniref:HAMP domain-containing sensor histidine kinase n=1 Tax=Sphingomonas sp. TaxID=28214 RepID=UPI001ACA36BB|nr:ATP-binding protein [Sphingomonas sp.]MBN8806829.1 HAMP domain-containing protein [Sphingomonas sp.]